MVITNIYLRLLFGTYSILIGIVLLKIYIDKDKDNIWGNLFKFGENNYNISDSEVKTDKIYIILGCLSIIGGLIVIFFGFRSTI